MRNARRFFALSVLMLVASGLLVNTLNGAISGILLAGGLGGVVGSINAALEEWNGK